MRAIRVKREKQLFDDVKFFFYSKEKNEKKNKIQFKLSDSNKCSKDGKFRFNERIKKNNMK